MTHHERTLSRRALLQMAVPLGSLAMLNPIRLTLARTRVSSQHPNKSWGPSIQC
jgi:hypothetical protein